MAAALFVAAALSAIGHLIADARDRRALVYLFKPLTTSLLIAAAASAPSADARYRFLILLGLVFSLAGDIFLMLPDHFQAGLVSFLLAHIAYIAAFRGVNRPRWLVLLPFLLIAAAVVAFLWRHLGRLRIAVLVYVLALVAMAWMATSRALDLRTIHAQCAAVGAALFLLSDATLAIQEFRAPFRGAQVAIMTTYVAAQALIAWSVTGTA